jgi:amino acid transporter/nucleotide-binding universal stress UspA family protein
LAKEKSKLLRELGLKEALALGLGTMIGAGIFVLPGIAVGRAGQAAAISYLLAGFLCLLVAMIIAELATGIPAAGGSYTFITRALGPLAGSIVGPANWLGLTFANGFYLIATGHYLSNFFPLPPWVFAIAFGLLFITVNYIGAKLSGGVQIYIVLVLVGILTLFTFGGLFNHPVIPRESFPIHGWGPVIGTIGLIIVSFTGFEKISTISEEIKKPGKNLPIAIIGSVIIATVLYVCLVFVATGLLPPGEIVTDQGLLVDASSMTFGRTGQMIMIFAALLATLSSANAATMASSRISYGMGRDLVLPEWFNFVHRKFRTPSNSIIFTGSVAIILAVTGKAEILAEISSALFMVSYSLLCLSVIIMRRVKPGWYRPSFRSPFFPLLPIITALLCLSVILTMNKFAQIAGVSLVILSLFWYFIWVRKNTSLTGEFAQLWERERPMEPLIEAAEAPSRALKHEILIPLPTRTKLDALLDLSENMVKDEDGGAINLLEMVVSPPQLPLGSLDRESMRKYRKTELANIIQKAQGNGVVVRSDFQAVRSLDTGTIAYVESHPIISLVLLAWKGHLTSSLIYESPIKNILSRVPCDVAVFLDKDFKGAHKILIPVGGGPHARLGLHLASHLARNAQTTLTAFRVLTPSSELDLEVEKKGLKRIIDNVLGAQSDRVKVELEINDSVMGAILGKIEKENYDLLVIGASEEWQIKSLLAGSLPDALAEKADCSVLMVRKYEPAMMSFSRRILSSLQGWK